MIPVNEPVLSTQAKRNAREALSTGWISSAGPFVNTFEEKFAAYTGASYGVTATNGTAALHLALAALGIGPGDEVIIPDLTIISCALAVLYTGATPVSVDVEPVFGTIDPTRIEQRITKKTRAIMVVHLYGHPADMDPIIGIAKKHKLAVIEDAAEAHGATYKKRIVGSIGDVGCFSFYANKLITTGEGGMVVTKSERIAEQLRLLKNLAHSPDKRFWHEEIGFNYRMTNMQAALGVGELSHIGDYIDKKRSMAELYRSLLEDIPYLELPTEASWAKSVYWMYAVRVTKESPMTKDALRTYLFKRGIDTRDFFYPIHVQPALRKQGLFQDDHHSVSIDLSQRGLYLPSGLAITKTQIRTVCEAVHEAFS